MVTDIKDAPEPYCRTGVLPKPTRHLINKHIEYYLEDVSLGQRTKEYDPLVVRQARECLEDAGNHKRRTHQVLVKEAAPGGEKGRVLRFFGMEMQHIIISIVNVAEPDQLGGDVATAIRYHPQIDLTLVPRGETGRQRRLLLLCVGRDEQIGRERDVVEVIADFGGHIGVKQMNDDCDAVRP